MLLKLIACNVFLREACLCIARSPHVICPEFLELGEHIHSGRLRRSLQEKIDEAERDAKNYDAILLLYGLCGNAVVGLEARETRLVMPRAHDCATILLGSRERFQEHFAENPCMPFSSIGYLERGNYFLRLDDRAGTIGYGDQYADLVQKYGDENARFIWETLHPPELESRHREAVFIDLPETSHLGGEQRFREKTEAEGKACRRLEGSLALIDGLLHGNWVPEDYLVVEPGESTAGVYDWSEIIRARVTENPGAGE